MSNNSKLTVPETRKPLKQSNADLSSTNINNNNDNINNNNYYYYSYYYYQCCLFVLLVFFTKAESFLHRRILITDVNFPFLLTLKGHQFNNCDQTLLGPNMLLML